MRATITRAYVGNLMQEASSDGALNEALHASCFLFNSVKEHLDASSEEVVSISRKDLTKLRRAALKVNRSIGTIVRQANQREQRLVVDMHITRTACKRDAIDQQAEKARIFERLRHRIGDGEGGKVTDALLDSAISDAARIEEAIRKLAPCAPTSVHGAGMLSAHSKVAHP
mgnify:FL=1